MLSHDVFDPLERNGGLPESVDSVGGIWEPVGIVWQLHSTSSVQQEVTSVSGISKYIPALVAPSNHLHLQVNYFVWDFLSYIFKSLTCPVFNRLVKCHFLLVRKSKT